jgi:hypothetical protein
MWKTTFVILLNAVIFGYAGGELITQGPWIINSTTNRRVHFKCANWYGAHQELFVPGGLERRSVAQLADFFKESGANCVRIPYSVEMAKYNPPVLASSVAGIVPSDGCRSVLTALDVMDCVVGHLRSRDILIIFNCHNSYGTWVGAGAQKYDQGLWNLPGFSTEDWVQSLETMARRYKMAGMDLRNEIHDQDGVKITWGQSDDVNTDWLAASSMAYGRLHAIDPEILAIVGGLCWNYDLRAMAKNVGPVQAFNNRKLVYTVHVYSFSFWWLAEDRVITKVITPLALGFFVLLMVASVLCFAAILKNNGASDYKIFGSPAPPQHNLFETLILVLGSSNFVFSFWLMLTVTYANVTSSVGCSTLAADVVPFVVFLAVMVGLSGVCFLLYVCIICCYPDLFSLVRVCAWATLWIALLFLSVTLVGLYLGTERSYLDNLQLFALNDRPVPVWIGEFGTGDPEDDVFQFLWRYIHDKYDLDFAYWPFNGMKWRNGQWESEPFGLMNDDYSGWRFPKFIKYLFS